MTTSDPDRKRRQRLIQAVERAHEKIFPAWLDSLERETWGAEEDEIDPREFEEWADRMRYRPESDGWLM